MINNSSSDKDLGPRQKISLVFLSIFLVVSLFFFRSGFKANEMLDQLAKNSLEPEIALLNGKPTVFEFYADWCEACKEMAPDMVNAEKLNSSKIDIVLLNVDNSRWFDLIDKYDVNGIPQLNLFDADAKMIGKSIGLKSQVQLDQLAYSLVHNQQLPNLLGVKEVNSSKVSFSPIFDKRYSTNVGPRSHS